MCVRASTNAFSYISHSLLRSHQENEKVTFLRPSLIGCTLCSSRSFSSPHPHPHPHAPCLRRSCENNTLTIFVLAVDQHTRFIVSGMWVAAWVVPLAGRGSYSTEAPSSVYPAMEAAKAR